MPFPAAYYGSPQQQLDLEFLIEIQNLGLRVPRRIADVLWQAYQNSKVITAASASSESSARSVVNLDIRC